MNRLILSERDRTQRNETNWFVACGITGMIGAFFWTESYGAVIAFGGIAGLIGERILALTHCLNTLIENLKPM